jgi:hypothetical protein
MQSARIVNVCYFRRTANVLFWVRIYSLFLLKLFEGLAIKHKNMSKQTLLIVVRLPLAVRIV